MAQRFGFRPNAVIVSLFVGGGVMCFRDIALTACQGDFEPDKRRMPVSA